MYSATINTDNCHSCIVVGSSLHRGPDILGRVPQLDLVDVSNFNRLIEYKSCSSLEVVLPTVITTSSLANQGLRSEHTS